MRFKRGIVQRLLPSRKNSSRRPSKSSWSSNLSILRFKTPRRRLSAVSSRVHSMPLLRQLAQGGAPVHYQQHSISAILQSLGNPTEIQSSCTLSLRALQAEHAVPTFFLRFCASLAAESGAAEGRRRDLELAGILVHSILGQKRASGRYNKPEIRREAKSNPCEIPRACIPEECPEPTSKAGCDRSRCWM